ncbi:MAG: hypothetical protein Q9186_006768, partial [Xanthomendoza sp. 1 TL-2023]
PPISDRPIPTLAKLSTPHTNPKFLIYTSHPFAEKFLYTPHLLSYYGITPTEWSLFNSALSSSISLTAGQRAKAIAAGVATGVLVNPGFGVVVGQWVWRRQIRRIMISSMEGYERPEEGSGGKGGVLGKVLAEWNRDFERRGVRLALVAPGSELEADVVVRQGEEVGLDGCGDTVDQGNTIGEEMAVEMAENFASEAVVDSVESVARGSGEDVLAKMSSEKVEILVSGVAGLEFGDVNEKKGTSDSAIGNHGMESESNILGKVFLAWEMVTSQVEAVEGQVAGNVVGKV